VPLVGYPGRDGAHSAVPRVHLCFERPHRRVALPSLRIAGGLPLEHGGQLVCVAISVGDRQVQRLVQRAVLDRGVAVGMEDRGREAARVLVAFEGGGAARNGLALAAQVADLDGAMIEVALLAGRVDEAEAWGAEIVGTLAESRLTVTLLHMPKAGLQILTDIAARRLSGLLVLGAERALAEGETGQRLLQRVPCSVLLVR